jgi:hypothetical protein
MKIIIIPKMKKLLAGIYIINPSLAIAEENTATQTNPIQIIDGILEAFYNIISGERVEKRDWDAFREWFLPTVRFTILDHVSSFTEPVKSVALDEMIKCMQDPCGEEGFLQYVTSKLLGGKQWYCLCISKLLWKDTEKYDERGT